MKRDVLVTIQTRVEIEVDETKFDQKFMEEFRQSFYSFHSLDDHLKHLAQLVARGLLSPIAVNRLGSAFIEGYGKPSEMGIRFGKVETLQSESVEEEVAVGRPGGDIPF